jgi:DNA gyrase subunit A
MKEEDVENLNQKNEKEESVVKGKDLLVDIGEEVKEAYLSYAMSVIVGRALPDVRDGLKPVHRRVLYAMGKLGNTSDKAYKKSARIVGEILGKYHPHGDVAVYDTIVRMAQDFSYRYPLIDGQGNFGCFTKDTKIRLADGRDLAFEELIKEEDEGKINYTFTFNPDTKRVEIAEIKAPRLTIKKAKIMKITLDNGEEIKCTLNHKLMLRDGTYREAKNLKAGDSLMPLYFKLCKGEEDVNLKGYKMVYQPTEDNNGVPKIENALKYFSDFQQIKERAKVHNHKVTAIEILLEREDVYDLTIENNHNFALAAGIFVHNSVDGDSAAAMRYTEVRMSKIAEELLADIDKETVNFVPNFDNSLEEPEILPAKIPHLLINGSSGIAVGMATNIPPHNLSEVIDVAVLMIEDPDVSLDKLMTVIKGPDFPTGGIICGHEGIRNAFETGRGSIKLQAVVFTEGVDDDKKEKKNPRIIIKELPYQVNKALLVEDIASLVQEKKIADITDLRDESDRNGMRVVIELKRGCNIDIVLNNLYKHTKMRISFGINNLAIDHGRPRLLNLKEMLQCFLEYRKEVVEKRTKYELKKAKERAHILEGLKIALSNIDEVVQIIKKSKNVSLAHSALKSRFGLSDIQAQSILDMRLQRLTSLETEKILEEYLEIIKRIAYLEDILQNKNKLMILIKEELLDLKEKYGDERRTKIIKDEEEPDIEDYISEEDIVITCTQDGYLKRLPLSTYRMQGRGGKGVIGMGTKAEDLVEQVFVTTNLHDILFFTSKGIVYRRRAYQIPEGGRTSRGVAIVNLLGIEKDEHITTLIPIESNELAEESKEKSKKCLFMATKKGKIKKVPLSYFSNLRNVGIIALRLFPEDELIGVRLAGEEKKIILTTERGNSTCFSGNQIRPLTRVASGLKGITINENDCLLNISIVDLETNEDLLLVTEGGFAKRTSIKEFREFKKRGGKGVRSIKLTKERGLIVAVKVVKEEDEIVLISQQGKVIRVPVKEIRKTGRYSQGVKAMNLAPEDKVASVALISSERVVLSE